MFSHNELQNLTTDKFHWLDLIAIILSILKLFSLVKNNYSFFQDFGKTASESSKKYIFLIYCGPLKVNFRWYMRILSSQCFFLVLLAVYFICSIIFQHLCPLIFFVLFLFYLFFVLYSPWDIFWNVPTMFNSSTLQRTSDCSISLQYTIQKIFTEAQTMFQNEERNDEKELL